jgi:hypothetical protein
MPIFAKTEVRAAKRADNNAYIIHMVFYYSPWRVFVNNFQEICLTISTIIRLPVEENKRKFIFS